MFDVRIHQNRRWFSIRMPDTVIREVRSLHAAAAAARRQIRGVVVSADPVVTIVIVTCDEESRIAAALDSCVAQTLAEIEILCMLDASNDAAAAIVGEYAARDGRIRLIRPEATTSVAERRRACVLAAQAAHVVFLEGDDEFTPEAMHVVVGRATAAGAAVVDFGIELMSPEDRRASTSERAAPQTDTELVGPDIVRELYPVSRPPRGLQGSLFATALVREAYTGLTVSMRFDDEASLVFLTVAAAEKYASTTARVYRRHTRKEPFPERLTSRDVFVRRLDAVDVINGIRSHVATLVVRHGDEVVAERYESVRLALIGTMLRWCVTAGDAELQATCLGMLQERAGALDTLVAASRFCPDALTLLSRAAPELTRSPSSAIRHVLLLTTDLGPGGVQAFVIAQTRHLQAAGFTVTIALLRRTEPVFRLPTDVSITHIDGASTPEQLRSWAELCRDAAPDIIIDHQVLYNRVWPFFALAARELGIPTVGWLHSFALRTLFQDGTDVSFNRGHFPLLHTVVTLSATDVAFWKLFGMTNVVQLPSPPSLLAAEMLQRSAPKALRGGPIRIVWWGRLQQSVKQVRTLLAVGTTLREWQVDFELTIIGPDTAELTAAQLQSEAIDRGIADVVRLPGPLYGDDLSAEIMAADIYLLTSLIEGAPLALVEAQASGLPVVMYELPWLSSLDDNHGFIAVEQDDATGVARAIASLREDPDRYAVLSEASRAAAARAAGFAFPALYAQLVSGSLPEEFSPEPTESQKALLLQWMSRYAELNARRREAERRDAARLRRQVAALRTERSDSLARRKEMHREIAEHREHIGDLRAHDTAITRELVAQRQRIAELRAELERRTEDLATARSPVPRRSLLRRVFDHARRWLRST